VSPSGSRTQGAPTFSPTAPKAPVIFNWQGAPRGRYPYTVALVDKCGHFACGGTVIAESVVLTAGHCAKYAYQVEIGRHNRTEYNDPPKYETINILRKIVHPSYRDPSRVDQALVLLDGKNAVPSVRLNRDPNMHSACSDVTVVGMGLD